MPGWPALQGDWQQQGRHRGSLDRSAPPATTLNSPTQPPGYGPEGRPMPTENKPAEPLKVERSTVTKLV
ncbi:hypothetical protein EKA83_33155, partial [Pseudomonas veronii]